MTDHDDVPASTPAVPGKRARRDVDPEPLVSDEAAPVATATRPRSEQPERQPSSRERGDKPQRSAVRRVTYWVGVGMILAGLGLLGYVAWQLWGTNWVSKKNQREITSQLREDWAVGEGCTLNCPEGKASALIRIPKFGKDYVVPVLEGATDGSISQDILAKGYGHFADTADPGQVGNYALAAHRITHGEPLRRMPDLRPGDKVFVDTRTRTYVYVLTTNPNDLVIPFNGVWVLDVLPNNPEKGGPEPKQATGQKLITLTTCSELFHTDNRMIAFGVLESETTRGKATTPAG